MVSGAIVGRNLCGSRLQGGARRVHRAHDRALRLVNGQEGGTCTSYDLEKDGHARIASTGSARPRHSTRPSSPARASSPTWRAGSPRARCSRRTARIWISPDGPAGRGRTGAWWTSSPTDPWWSSCTFAFHGWLAREVLKEAGDAVVLEPEDACRHPRGGRVAGRRRSALTLGRARPAGMAASGSLTPRGITVLSYPARSARSALAPTDNRRPASLARLHRRRAREDGASAASPPQPRATGVLA